MRVVGGEWGSRRLRPPADRTIRPTSDRLRETLFNILGPALAGQAFVDAYAGTGAVGIEAFSRGARPVAWVEASPAAARLLRANLASLEALHDPAALVVEQRLPAALARLARWSPLQRAGGAAVVFLDPPYADADATERFLLSLDRHPDIAAPGALVVAETSSRLALPAHVGRWSRTRLHRQGDAQLGFFESKD